MKQITVALLLCLIGCNQLQIPDSYQQTATKTKWYTDFHKAIKEGQKQKRYIFVFFTESWCVYCQKMKKEVLLNPKINNLLKKHFIVVMLNTKHRLYQKSHKKGVPDYFIMNPYTQKIVRKSRYPGYQNANQFYKFLNLKSDDK